MSTASAFQRSPSKVWWAQDLQLETPDRHDSDLWRASRHSSGSPNSHKSQDSGFSDSEISPSTACDRSRHEQREQIRQQNSSETPKRIFSTEIIPTDILKDNLYNENTPKKNYKESITEKYSPKKSIINKLTEENFKKGRLYEKRINQCCRSAPSTPRSHRKQFALSCKSTSAVPSPLHSPLPERNERLTLYSPRSEEGDITPKSSRKIEPKSEPRQLFSHRSSPKVNRNLLNCYPKEEPSFSSPPEDAEDKIYSNSLPYIPVNEKPSFNATVPLFYDYQFKENHLEEGVTSFSSEDVEENSSTPEVSSDVVDSSSFSYQNNDENLSDCEKEVQSFFLDRIEPPVHFSTPKNVFGKDVKRESLRRFTKEFKSLEIEIKERQSPVRINPKSQEQVPSVKCWLDELEHLYEPECMTTLQSKSIAMDLGCQVNRIVEEIVAPITDMLRHSRIINKEFKQMHKHIENQSANHLGPLTQSLVGNVTEYVLKCITHFQENGLTNTDQKQLGISNLLEVVKQLRIASNSSNINEVGNLVTKLQEAYHAAEYNLLGLEVQLLISQIEDSKSNIKLRAVLSGITMLSLQCERISNLVVRTGGPRALLILCVECRASTIRTMALRALATVCCSTSAIKQLEQADGIDVLADILSDYNRPEPELSEAVAVLAQITAPWIEDNHKVQGLASNAESLVETITHFLEQTKCCQNLLLCAAALANLTYMNLDTAGSIIKHNTIGKLLTAVRNRGPKASVFLKEQTATLIANLSDDAQTQIYLSDNNAAVALLCFLQDTPVCPNDEAQSNSAQRLQQKSAIALSRLCSDADVAKQIVDLGGVSKLTQLCKDGRERHNSDAVLVACLATLRKIVANCGNGIMDQQDVMELVEPRLLDSFLAYSSQNESYV